MHISAFYFFPHNRYYAEFRIKWQKEVEKLSQADTQKAQELL